MIHQNIESSWLSEEYKQIMLEFVKKHDPNMFEVLETDFATLNLQSVPRKMFYEYPDMASLAKYNDEFSPMKTKTKNKKVKVPSVKTLLRERKEMCSTIDRLRKDLYEKNEHISNMVQRGNRSEVRIHELQERDQSRLKAIGLYFATIDSEAAQAPDSLEHLRMLRSEIFR